VAFEEWTPAREAELVARCARGDRDAWAAFLDRFGGLVAALARRRLARHTGSASAADVDEVVAEVFLALLRRDRHLLRQYDPRFRVSTYLGVICRTAVLRHLRSREGAESLSRSPGPAAPAAEGPAARALGADAAARVRSALGTLEDRDRALLTLRYLDGWDYAAIAGAVGVSPDSVGSLLHRARARLARVDPALRDLLAD
jgi:RNA polymerase sigma-70 factor (ECF subfamily)